MLKFNGSRFPIEKTKGSCTDNFTENCTDNFTENCTDNEMKILELLILWFYSIIYILVCKKEKLLCSIK